MINSGVYQDSLQRLKPLSRYQAPCLALNPTCFFSSDILRRIQVSALDSGPHSYTTNDFMGSKTDVRRVFHGQKHSRRCEALVVSSFFENSAKPTLGRVLNQGHGFSRFGKGGGKGGSWAKPRLCWVINQGSCPPTCSRSMPRRPPTVSKTPGFARCAVYLEVHGR